MALVAIYDNQYLDGTMRLGDPTIAVPNWIDDDLNRALKIDGELWTRDEDYFVGIVRNESGTDLVLWVKQKGYLSSSEDHRNGVKIVSPKSSFYPATGQHFRNGFLNLLTSPTVPSCHLKSGTTW